ncbi:MAG: hypothetical protein EU535_00245 [Promethearchaeota archaeon]|nr:MAG: hypothetical protein EU535_00245 [Candidatus Lokiarchaeota archaeon]
MAELKNLIIVDITDHENIILAPAEIGATGDHIIKEIKAKGTLLIKNTSTKSRLWNVNCDLKEVVNTNLQKVLNVGAINPGQEFKQEYQIQNLKEPLLKVLEVLDAERDISVTANNAFLYENANKCNLKLSLMNTLDIPFTEIMVSKELPAIFQDIEIKSPSIGNAEQVEEDGKRILSWKIEGLGAKETATIEVFCTVIAKERKDQSLGGLKINYVVDNKILTMISPQVRGETDSMSGVTRDEGTNPGTWDCNVEFINDSEFNVRLEEVKVTHKIPTGVENVVSETPNVELNPDSSWDRDFPIESANVPELESEIVFTPLFGLITRVIGEIIKEPTYYHVLSAEVHKAINPPEVAAYANTDITIVNTIPNKGTATLDTLDIIDELPPDFVPPLMKQIKIELKNSEGSLEIQERTEFIEKIGLEPDDQNPDAKHLITLKLKNLKKQVPPGSDIIISYPLLAKNPKPEVRYNTPVQIKANVPVKGKDFIISPPEEPVIKIKYVARKLKTLKSIKPGLTEGEFNITVRIQNKGDVELENIVVKDKIPAGFTLTETNFDLPYEMVGSDMEIKIVELKGNDSININYSCSGQGDYPRTEPIVQVLGREGVAATTSTSSATEIPKASDLSQSKSVIVHEIFSTIFQKVDQGITGIQLADLLETKRDQLPPGPILHQMMQFAKEIRENAKIIVGEARDKVIAKLNEYKSKYA